MEYPRRGTWSIGFVTGTPSSQLQAALPKRSLNVFIPTTPNPTSGWYAIIPEDEAISLAISIEDAFKVLISGGIVSPDDSPVGPPVSLPDYKKLKKIPLEARSADEARPLISLEEES